jgi:prepilin-type N-terminal cleavage/methylation domain-containing protein/prepilin-type processing-associated H-X9-DG protein
MQTIRALRGRGTAFSLVELLVVISIIGVLAAMLLPALGAAVQHAINVQCQNNLKGIAAAVLNYVTDNRGSIPPTKYGSLYWCDILVRGEYIPADNTAKLSTSEESPGSSVLRCPLSYYVSASAGSGTIVLSESDTIQYPARFDGEPDVAQGTARLGDSNLKVDCSYYWNGYTKGGTGPIPPGTEDLRQRYPSLDIGSNAAAAKAAQLVRDISEIRSRTSLVMLADGVLFDAETNRARIAARHIGSNGDRTLTNIVYYDGHVGSIERSPGEDNTFAEDPLVTTDPTKTSYPGIFMIPKR